ncbi:hypothetical protein ACWGJX_42230 [Streptomyces sp. NPDC054775]
MSGVLPGVIIFGLGMSLTVATLTSAVLSTVSDDRAGAAAGASNAISRAAGLITIAVLPSIAGIDVHGGASLSHGFHFAILVSAGACVLGAVALLTIKQGPGTTGTVPGTQLACRTAACLESTADPHAMAHASDAP